MNQIQYPYQPEGRQVKYVGLENPFMAEAKKVQETLSTDLMHSTGAVLVKNGSVVASGANQSKLKPGSWLFNLHKKRCIRRMLHIPTGTHYWVCPGCSTNKQHAEGRAVRDAKAKGIDTNGTDLYLYGHWWCCEPCWNEMISGGIKDVFLLEGSERFFARGHKDSMIGKK